VDQDAEFHFVPADRVFEEAERIGATPFDVKGVELGHHGKECSFEAILKKYHLASDRALAFARQDCEWRRHRQHTLAAVRSCRAGSHRRRIPPSRIQR